MAQADARAGVLFDAAQDKRLAEIYAPCFTLILQLRAASEFGDPEVLRRRIKDLLDRSEREAMRLGVDSADVRAAKFALVAFLDETILLSEWSMKEYWAAKPLQLELYNRYDAGEQFFDKFDELMEQVAARAETLEVYYLCLTLGFKGRYQLHEQERLRVLIEDALNALRRAPGMHVDELAPHGEPRDQVVTEVRNKVPAWVIAAMALGLFLLIYIGMSLYIESAADSTAQIIRQVPPTQAVQ